MEKLHTDHVIAHFDIQQGTPEWHEIRYGKVGGVLSKSLMGKPETLINHIGSCLLEPFELEEDGYINDDMQRGIDLEPYARQEASKYAGVEFLECGWIQSKTIPLAGVSPDGITKDLKIAVSIKCPARTKHAATLYSGEIPDDNIEQCIHEFTVNPHLEKCYFLSFRPECKHPMFIKFITLDSIVDLGTKAKPVCKTVREWAGINRSALMTLESNIKIYNDNLEKI